MPGLGLELDKAESKLAGLLRCGRLFSVVLVIVGKRRLLCLLHASAVEGANVYAPKRGDVLCIAHFVNHGVGNPEHFRYDRGAQYILRLAERAFKGKGGAEFHAALRSVGSKKSSKVNAMLCSSAYLRSVR